MIHALTVPGTNTSLVLSMKYLNSAGSSQGSPAAGLNGGHALTKTRHVVEVGRQGTSAQSKPTKRTRHARQEVQARRLAHFANNQLLVATSLEADAMSPLMIEHCEERERRALAEHSLSPQGLTRSAATWVHASQRSRDSNPLSKARDGNSIADSRRLGVGQRSVHYDSYQGAMVVFSFYQHQRLVVQWLQSQCRSGRSCFAAELLTPPSLLTAKWNAVCLQGSALWGRGRISCTLAQ
jgi:hypothetical protein